MTNKDIWTVKLDWLNIINHLGLNSIKEIPDFKKDKAIKRLTKDYGIDTLMGLNNNEIDLLVVNELKDLMRKELSLSARRQQRMEKRMMEKMIPFKQGGIIKIDPREFDDLDPNADPEEIMKYLYKKFMGKGDSKDSEDKDDDKDNYSEDSTGYYI